MVALQIEDVKNFMTKLLLQTTFDGFLAAQAEIVTGTTITIDGHLNLAFFDTEECTYDDGTDREYAYWSELRDTCFQRIKGKKLPLSFHITLLLSAYEQREIYAEETDSVIFAPIENLYLNIHYDNRGLFCTTGASYNMFTLNKSAEQSFDRYIIDFLQTQDIAFTKSSLRP